MKSSLKGKMILSYLTVAFITVLVVSVFIRLTSGQSLMNLVAEQQTVMLQESVKNYYSTYGTMDGFASVYLQDDDYQPGPDQPQVPGEPPGIHELRGVRGLVDAEYRSLLPSFGMTIGQAVPNEFLKDAIAVEVDGQTIAWILPDTKYDFKLNAAEELFLKRTNLAIGMAALAGVAVAVGMGFFLASRLIRPIRRLTAASEALARGDLQQQVPVTSRDELGLLTTTFNRMSTDLAQADQQRKRITADITHDLSTPLQIISGYVEMLEDDEVKLTPQRLEIIKTEIGHLRRLVGDLTTLSQAEAGGLDIQLQAVQPSTLLERVYNAYQPIVEREGVRLLLDLPEGSPHVMVDEGRMLQVLKNLVENALRYTPKGGSITLAAGMGSTVELRITDTGSGIDAEDLPYVFDRFYRADRARAANSGKMGLGLAICKALVNAQGGSISAQSAGKNQGTTMTIRLKPCPPPA